MLAGRFKIGKKLSMSRMGTVYRGTDAHTQKLVAIKAINPGMMSGPDMFEQFSREAEMLRQLHHPNIVGVITTIEKHGRYYIIMEYVSGGSLRDLLSQYDILPLRHILEMMIDLVDALTHAHRLDIIHRDIKPENVLIADDITLRLSDFGMALLERADRMTETRGTVYYISPEELNGDTIDNRADIWSLGVMLYEVLIGHRPFSGENVSQISTSIISQPVPRLKEIRSDLPDDLVDLIYNMLQKKPASRISRIHLVGAELEKILQSVNEMPLPSTPHSIGGTITSYNENKKPTKRTREKKSVVPDRLQVVMPDKSVVTCPSVRPYLLIGRKTSDARARIDIDMNPYDEGVVSVSRIHARLTPDDKHGLIIKDLDSVNGTYLNQNRLNPQKNYPVQSGDTIKVGNLRIQLFFGSD